MENYTRQISVLIELYSCDIKWAQVSLKGTVLCSGRIYQILQLVLLLFCHSVPQHCHLQNGGRDHYHIQKEIWDFPDVFKSPETSEKGNLLFLFSCDHTIPTGIVYFSALGFNLFVSHCVLGFHTDQFPLAKTEGTIFPFWLQLNKRTGW